MTIIALLVLSCHHLGLLGSCLPSQGTCLCYPQCLSADTLSGAGRLGKAWCAGYDCRSLDELRLVYGAHRCLM